MVISVPILISLPPSSVPWSKLFDLSVPHVQIWGPDNPVSPDPCEVYMCEFLSPCGTKYIVGAQGLAVGPSNQDVNEKDQPRGTGVGRRVFPAGAKVLRRGGA